MSWRIEKQANGKWAIWSSRVEDYVVIDADEMEIARRYAEKGVRVYLASASMQFGRAIAVSREGEAKIAVSRQRGSTPKEGPVPIGATGVDLNDDE